MYWTSWNRTSYEIERASLDGQARETILSRNYSTANPNSYPIELRLDYTNQMMYWWDSSTNSIESSFVNGTKISTVISQIRLYFPQSFAIFENQIYWRDYDEIVIASLTDNETCDHRFLYGTYGCPYNMKLAIVSDSMQKTGN